MKNQVVWKPFAYTTCASNFLIFVTLKWSLFWWNLARIYGYMVYEPLEFFILALINMCRSRSTEQIICRITQQYSTWHLLSVSIYNPIVDPISPDFEKVLAATLSLEIFGEFRKCFTQKFLTKRANRIRVSIHFVS